MLFIPVFKAVSHDPSEIILMLICCKKHFALSML